MSEQPTPWPDDAIQQALTDIGLPAGIVDRNGVLRWSNRRSIELFGDHRGMPYRDVVAAESKAWTELALARVLVGGQRTLDWRTTVVDRHGRRLLAEVHAVALHDGDALIGVFGFTKIDHERAGAGEPARPLTSRQLEVLRALADGATTRQIAESLGIATETVRNYVRGILRALDVHSRLEAVLEARRLGLV